MLNLQFDVAKIKPKNISVQNDKPDELSKKEEKQYELDAIAEKQRLENEAIGQNIKERKKYAGHIFWLIVGWLVLLFVVLGLQGFKYCEFELSENVLLALITGTTVNILGIFVIVVNYLFRR